MSNDSSDRSREIAAQLSVHQRAAMIDVIVQPATSRVRRLRGGKVLYSLRQLGCVHPSTRALTDLGLAVRAHLEKSSD